MVIGAQDSVTNTSISALVVASQDLQKGRLLRSLLKYLLSWTETDESRPGSTDVKGLRVVCISDTHNLRPELPPGDILLHAGDLSQYGLFDEIQNQLDWLNSQPHLHKIIVPGNHDLLLDQEFVERHPDRELDSIPGKRYANLRWGGVKCLVNSCVEVVVDQQRLTIFGSPLTPRCGSFAFQYAQDLDVWKDILPDHVDVLLTHGPPALHLDQEKGCKFLLREVRRVRPKLVVFGHIHSGRGEEWADFTPARVCYEEALLGGWPWLKVPLLAWHVMWDALVSRASPQTPVHLVNAAVAFGPGNRNCEEPIVVGL